MIAAALIIAFFILICLSLEDKHDKFDERLREMEAEHRRTIYGDAKE